jgi:hypothetical protein
MPTTQIIATQVRQDLPSGSPMQQNVTIELTEEGRLGTKRRKPSGWIPPTNYQLTSVNRRGSTGEYSILNQFGGVRYTGAVAGAIGPYGPLTT